MAVITIELAGVDRTTFIYEPSGLAWDNQTNGIGSASFTFRDQVGGGATITPTEGQTLVVKEDGTAVFSGILTDPGIEFLGPDASDQNALYACTALSKEYITNKRKVWKAYVDETFEAIVADINTNFLSDEGLDGATAVEAGSIHTITFNGESVTEAYDLLCAKEADGRTWWIDVSDQIVMQVLASSATPATLDKDNLLWNVDGATDPTFDTEKSGYANVVTVIGGNPDMPIKAQSIDAGEITARIAAEGGSGRYEYKVEMPDIRTENEVQSAAGAILAERVEVPQVFVGTTRVSGFEPGQQGTVNLPNIGLSAVTMFVTNVRTESRLGNTEFWHTVTMSTKSNPDGGWQAYYRRDKKRHPTIPLQVEPAPGIVRIESTAGPLSTIRRRSPPNGSRAISPGR